MAEPLQIRARFKQILEEKLNQRASRVLLDRLLSRVDQTPTEPASLRQFIENTRVAIRMFVDVDLAEELWQTLMQEVKAHQYKSAYGRGRYLS